MYTPKNGTLINLFGITTDEQRQLKTIISSEMAQERDRKRHEVRRRAAGAVDRETFLQAAQDRRSQAQMLRAEGMSIRAIAALMGVSKTAVGRYLSDAVDRLTYVTIDDDETPAFLTAAHSHLSKREV